MVAIVLIYLLAVVFKTETTLMKIGDKITAFFYRLDVALTRLFHWIIPIDLTTFPALIDHNSDWQRLIRVVVDLNSFSCIVLYVLLSCTSSRLEIAFATDTVLRCKDLIMIILCHGVICNTILAVLSKATKGPVTFEFGLEPVPRPGCRNR